MSFEEIDTNSEQIMEKKSAGRKPVLEIKEISKSFGNNHVLRNFNLNLYENENVAILGQSGSGKSVLIKCVVGLIKPDKGVIKIFDQNIHDLDQTELDKIRQKIGFLFQSNALYDSMTIRENLEFPLRRHRLLTSPAEVEERIIGALENVGLAHTIDMMPSELSGGMKKRIGLARTLILNPAIILYDEPTTGLDPITSKEIGNLLNTVHRKYNTSSIIISHDLATIKLVANRIIILLDGTNYFEGTYDEVSKSDDPRVNSFFN